MSIFIKMRYKYSVLVKRFTKITKSLLLFMLLFLIYSQSSGSLLYAQSSFQNIHIDYKNHFLTLSTENVDLKNVLIKLADKTDIYFEFPSKLEKKITIDLNKVSLREALNRILKDVNHVFIYTGEDRSNAVISKVLVYKKNQQSGQTRISNPGISNRIRNYEQRIAALQRNLSRSDLSDSRRQNYLRQLRRLENNIENLRRR